MSKTEFMPFPESRTQQIEAAARASAPYQSPHHPMKRTPVVAANMKTSIDVESLGLPTPAAAPIATPAATIPVVAPGFSTPTSNDEAVLISLPSGYAFYEFKDLYIVPFKGRHLSKLSRAREEGSTLHTVEAVSSVLSTPDGRQHLAFDLTIPDFYYVLYWLRMNSFTKTTFVHTSSCSDPDHVQRVASGELSAETLKHSEVITKASLKETLLKEIPNPERFALEYPNAWPKPATMRDALEMLEDPDFVNEDFRYAAELACNLGIPDVVENGVTRRATLRERIAVVDDMSPDDHVTIRTYEKSISDYGITESVQIKCKHCAAAPRTEPIVLDAHCFFPSAR